MPITVMSGSNSDAYASGQTLEVDCGILYVYGATPGVQVAVYAAGSWETAVKT